MREGGAEDPLAQPTGVGQNPAPEGKTETDRPIDRLSRSQFALLCERMKPSDQGLRAEKEMKMRLHVQHE